MIKDKVAIISIISIAFVVLSVVIFMNSGNVTGKAVGDVIYYCWGDSITDNQITTETSTPYHWYSQRSWSPYCFTPVNTCNGWCVSKGYASGMVGADTQQCTCSVASTPTTCTDTDGGKSYNVKGTVTGDKSGGTYTDTCSGNQLREYYCQPDGWAASIYYTCPSGQVCSNGACVASAPATSTTYYCWGDSATDFRVTTDATKPHNWYRAGSWSPYCFTSANTCNSYCKSKGFASGLVGSNTQQCVCSSGAEDSRGAEGLKPVELSDEIYWSDISFYRQSFWTPYSGDSYLGDLTEVYDPNVEDTKLFEHATAVPRLDIYLQSSDSLSFKKNIERFKSVLTGEEVVSGIMYLVPSDNQLFFLYYNRYTGNTTLAGYFNYADIKDLETEFATITTESMKLTLGIYTGLKNGNEYIYITVNNEDPATDPSDNDDFAMQWKIGDSVISGGNMWYHLQLGENTYTAEVGEVRYGAVTLPRGWIGIGTRNTDLQNKGGLIIENPEWEGNLDQVVFKIIEDF